MPVTLPDRPFESFQKINRAKTGFGCVITEKLDGSNGQIVIEDNKIVGVGSRQRWIKPGRETDNYGYAAWVERNEEELVTKLGDGTHFGEWYGNGIQRNYGLAEKRFALFNSGRWSDANVRPACCECVPVLYAGEFTREAVNQVMRDLATEGSRQVPGFMKPEGIIIYLAGPRVLLKETFEHSDGKWKSETPALSIAA
ncbi:RNA ligase family protein [Pararhizobium qamdonense]|uniref:RNA ligase family protein n=1 Tax=Pararhizobium qamdonense TaxID=3031126 RepID=UPI0023E2C0D2|nr:RNA ligase family protein [Pararhizobium qamdonense]